MCTRQRVIAVWLSIALILAAISLHFFVTFTYPVYLPNDPQAFCYVQPVYERFFDNVWRWIDFTLLAFVPFVVVLTGNCVIITCVVRAARFRHSDVDSHPGARCSVVSSTAGDKGKAVTSSTVIC